MFNSTQQPQNEQRIVNVLSILALATNKNITLSRAAQDLGFSDDYVSDFKRRHNPQSYSKDVYDQYVSLMLRYETQRAKRTSIKSIEEREDDLNRQQLFFLKDHNEKRNIKYDSNAPVNLYGQKKVVEYKNPVVADGSSVSTGPKVKDLNVDEAYDKRSTCGVNRDSNNLILNYWYKILVRDQPPFMGTLTREQMETIHANYPYVTATNCSSYFPYLTFIQFKLLLRVFSVTKDKKWGLHTLEEHSEENLAEFALKAKEHASLKKMVEMKPLFIEKQLREVQKEVFDIKEDKEWVENLIEKYYTNKSSFQPVSNKEHIDDNSNEIIYCLFSDLHYGKKFNRPVFGRPYNKEIAHERVMEIASKTVKYCLEHNPQTLIIGFFGDLIENFLEGGFHQGQVLNQDLHQDEQIFFAVDSLKESLLYIREKLPNICIKFNVIPGNHGRADADRKNDKNRTPEKIAFKILKRELDGIIDIHIPDNNIINIKNGDIQLIGFHGDNSLLKRKSHELVNLFGAGNTAYHLVVSGHYHRTKIEAGTNYMSISLPSVCSTDEYVLEDLGLNNLPGFILGKQTTGQKAFDYTYVNLY